MKRRRKQGKMGHEIFYRLRPLLFLLLAFLAGCVCTSYVLAALFLNRQRPATVGGLDSRYAEEHGRATETIGRLAAELERERGINRELREYNRQARGIADGLTKTAQRNVRNLQEAVVLIGEIRAKLKVLADFYAHSDTGNGVD